MPQHCKVVPLPAPDKNATLGAQMRAVERLRAFDRRATLEHITSFLAHELGSPLNVIDGRAAIVLSNPNVDPEVRRNVRIIAEQSTRMARLLSEVVTYCRRARGRTTEVDLVQLAQSAVGLLDRAALEHQATITLDEGDTPGVTQGDPEALLVALTHLLENGLDSTPPGGTLRVGLRSRAVSGAGGGEPGAQEICIDVADDGPGVAADRLPALFMPFTTTHGAREASGIGLFVAQAIAKDHGGWIEGVAKPESGALFTLHLPGGATHAK